MRAALHIGVWFVAVAVALFLPFVGFAAMQQIGRQLWPLFVGWAALALFIVYAAVASMGVFAWLPIDWHLAGPVGLFESLMVPRSEERRVGQECVRTCRSRVSQYH